MTSVCSQQNLLDFSGNTFVAKFLIFERDKECERNGLMAYFLYDESHFSIHDEVVAKNQELR